MPELHLDLSENPDQALELEWIETDGLGGFSSSTLALANTRCYHAVLNPAVTPPLGRRVLWARSEETLVREGISVPLASHYTAGGLGQDGHRRLAAFTARPWPRWTYRVGGGTLERELFLAHGRGDVHLLFRWSGPGGVELAVRPLLAFRDHHEVARFDPDVDRRIREMQDGIAIRFRDPEPALFLNGPFAFEKDEQWHRDLALPVEAYRGLPDRDTLWSPGALHLTLEPGDVATLRAGIHPPHDEAWDVAQDRERQRRETLRLEPLEAVEGMAPLAHAADQFLVARRDSTTVIAGYPWFTDWGRDTMIALPGLTLATGRHRVARELLATFAAHEQDGLIPNRFPDEGEVPEYNTVDATLWFSVALRATWRATGDDALLEQYYPLLERIRDHHQAGTRHGIRVDQDGLLLAGEPGVQLTWMDAKVEDWVVTPREGKPVEIQALWYNFLRIGARAAVAAGADATAWDKAARSLPQRFLDLFWDTDRGYLADVVSRAGEPDWAFRPNQLFALSLPYPLLDAPEAHSVIDAVRRRLLTPRGLRSLDPDHPDFHPRYGGDRRTRDAAYHQGTVWGWLIGPYLDAVLRFQGDPGRQEALDLLAGWSTHLEAEGCVGQASEVFDATQPHAPRGCPAQAWTVAELLRIAVQLADPGP